MSEDKISKEEKECCLKFDPVPWDSKILDWDNKNFIKGKVFTLFYAPVNFGSVIRKLMKKMNTVQAVSPDNICLSDHTSKWNMDIYLSTDSAVPDVGNTLMSGSYLSRVYEGSFKETNKWYDDYKKYAAGIGLNIGKIFMWYTTCPACAKKYGKNYVVIIGKINK